jgi:16S rRNA (guanine527-N7)-methyltransferase
MQAPTDLLRRFDVSRESLARLEAYVQLLLTWQQRINLIGPSARQDIWERHIVDALQLLPLLPKTAKSFADLGSGAGIPGLVIAIATGLHGHLYESNGKKVAFLREAIRLTAAPAQVHQVRIESLGGQPDRPRVDLVFARALAPLPKLFDLAEPFLKDGATGFFHKGQDVEVELKDATSYWKLEYVRHRSALDSKSAILEVKEAKRVEHRGQPS